MELLVSLDRRAAEPLHAQLERQLRTAIRAGRLSPGTKVPSTRELARDLGVSRRLVVETYAQLTAEGYLRARQGAPTRVAGSPADALPEPAPERPPFAPYELHPGAPDLASFPRGAWVRSLRAAVRRAPDVALHYPDPRGAPELRTALAAYLSRARGAHAAPGRIIVTTGAGQGVALTCRALRARGARRLAVEDPGFHVHRFVAAHAGLELVGVPVDADGLDTGALAAAGADAVLVTPAHQSPMGAVLAPHRRAELVRWCEDGDRFVLEDDYDAEYRYDRAPVGTLQGLAPDRVVYVGSASKVLAPGLRLGWLLLPPALADAVAGEKALDDHGTGVLEQLTLADFLERGELDRHLRRMRPRYRARRDALAAALGRALPELELQGAPAGLHALAMLPAGIDEAALCRAGRRRGVGLHGLTPHRLASTGPGGLTLGFAGLSEPALEAAVGRIVTALDDVAAGQARRRASATSRRLRSTA